VAIEELRYYSFMGALSVTRKFRIGTFFSSSSSFPQADGNLSAGFRAGISGMECEVLVYPAEVGAKRLGTTISRAYLADRLDMAVVNAGYTVLPQLMRNLEMYRKPVFFIGSGADVVREAELHPLVFRHTMLYWQCAYEAGLQTARKHGGRVLLVTAMLDCCYDSHAAFLSGVREGGAEEFFHVCDAPDYEFHKELLTAAIERIQPTSLAVYASGSMAVRILEALATIPGVTEVPVIFGPMLHEEPLLSCLGQAAAGMSYFSWPGAGGLPSTPESEEFLRHWSEVSQAEPDCFAVAGYEAALFVRGAVEKCEEKVPEPAALCSALEGMVVTGPRGKIVMDERLHVSGGAVCVREFAANGVAMVPDSRIVSVALSEADPRCVAVSEGHLNRWTSDYWQS
jgi:hypothetical protein